ncbi:hypothetical protein P154DRAFT_557963 [Amniculicola lignicola CBS 123094]|uniref:Tat pathway signal sequence n=1 Tax=Amniculicola lignicola CBS 123094 TaxID=1392246 RepID=A0A6A5VW34_9PLEO|nr:hypothetical protein P154DRAFT_557963 [Amniculicola lignicola CBS 123094]
MDSKYENAPYNDDESRTSGEYEKAAFLNSQYMRESRQKRQMMWLTFINLFVFVVSAMTLVCAIFSQRSTSSHSVAKLMDQFDIYSPAMHVVEYHHRKFELAQPINASKYVGITHETENAWVDIAELPDQMITLEDFPKLQKPATSLRVTNPKTGETGYRVGLEVFHQLSCLNMIRIATYPDYHLKMEWSDENDSPEHVREHLDDCIETLRMSLMCMSDVNVFTFHDTPGREQEGAVPDYGSHHVCRNFDGIKRWALENAMPETVV